MKTIKQIRNMWTEFTKKPFPREVMEQDFNEICLATTDTFVAGCISCFVDEGKLDENRKEILKSCLNDIETVMPDLVGESKEYYLSLKEICIEIIKIIK